MKSKARLYIVDDEMMAIQYFRTLAQKADYPNEVVGEAVHGVKALEEIEKLNPDLIFADISMPVMNGLVLAENLLKRNPGCKVVLLTSYRDFDFVKKGLEIGVCSYLLKNELTEETLGAEISRIMEQIAIERKKAHTYVEYNLKQYLTTNVILENQEDYIYGCNSLNRFALVMLVRKHPIELEPSEFRGFSFDAMNFEELEFPKGLVCRNAVQIAEDKWCAIFFIGAEVPDGEALLVEAAERMLGIFEERERAVCIVSRGTRKFLEMPSLYHELDDLSRYLFFRDEKHIFTQKELEKHLDSKEKVDKKLMEIIRAAEAQERGTVLQIIYDILKECENCYTQAEYTEVIKSLQGIFSRFARKRVIDENRLPRRNAFENTAQVREYLENLINTIFDALELWGKQQYSKNVMQILDYIHRNYKSNIAVSDIAESVKLSEGHLRKCFKSETGVTVVDYLTEYRIERAKELMQQGERITSVYERVGFTSSQYFSYVFKKKEGVSPSEYLKTL